MFKKLKSLFVTEDGSGKPQTPQENKTSPQKESAAPKIEVVKPVFDKDNPPKGKVDEKFINRLLGALDDANLDGFDYLEYKQALQNLVNVEMDEPTKFKSALAMAKTMGTTPQNLIDSANHYLQVLKREENKFLEAFRNQMSRQINNNNTQLKSLEESLVSKKKRIEELQKEIESETQKLNKMKVSVDNSKAKVEATKNSFYQAYHIVAEQIKDDLAKMKKYL